MTISEITVLGALIFGATIGIGPCIFTCGPLFMPYLFATQKSCQLFRTVLVIFGRLTTYTIIGLVATLFGNFINNSLIISNILAFIFLCFCVMFGVKLLIMGVKGKLCFRKTKLSKYPFVFGIFLGVYPCAPLLIIFTYVITSMNDLFYGTLLFIFFGIGSSIPLLIMGTVSKILPNFLNTYQLQIRLQRVYGAIFLLIGLKIGYKLYFDFIKYFNF